ncbi:hypothetical protein VTO42DRAFT_4239 [Malbranchea cinnamomea]
MHKYCIVHALTYSFMKYRLVSRKKNIKVLFRSLTSRLIRFARSTARQVTVIGYGSRIGRPRSYSGRENSESHLFLWCLEECFGRRATLISAEAERTSGITDIGNPPVKTTLSFVIRRVILFPSFRRTENCGRLVRHRRSFDLQSNHGRRHDQGTIQASHREHCTRAGVPVDRAGCRRFEGGIYHRARRELCQ